MRILILILAAVLAVASGPAVLASNDPGFGDQWGLHKVGAEKAWGSSKGTGMVVAVIDTGVDLNHPDLKANLVGGRNYVEPGQPPMDDHGHGTHVAGIAAAVTNNGRGVAGTAPSAKIMPVRVMKAERDIRGRETASGYTSDVNDGIRWAADNGAHVINLSLGDLVNIKVVTGSSSFQESINYAWSRGSIPVISAGNDNQDILFPSGYRNVNAIVVGATTPNDSAASFSNDVGDAKWGMVAPGTDILSTWKDGKYATASGTSMATPFVAGAAALVRAQGLKPQQTVDRLLSTARDVGSEFTYGHGRLDAAAAVVPAGQPPPAGQPAPPPNSKATAAPTRTSPGGKGAPAASAPAPADAPEEPTPTPGPAGETPRPGSTPIALAQQADEEPARSNRPLVAMLVLGGLLAAGGGAIIYLRLRPGP